MQIIYLNQYFKFPDEAGGTRSYDLASSFVKKGIKVTVISSNIDAVSDDKRRWVVYEPEGIRFYMLNCRYDNSMNFLQRIVAFLSFMYFASIKALTVKCDLVLATSTPLAVAVPALIRKWIKRTPFVFEVRDVWPDVPIRMGVVKNRAIISLLYWFEKIIYRHAAWIVPLSTGMNENIQQRFPNTKYTIIPNISELDRFERKERQVQISFDPRGKKIILYAGAFGNVSGLKYLVDMQLLMI